MKLGRTDTPTSSIFITKNKYTTQIHIFCVFRCVNYICTNEKSARRNSGG